MAEALTGLGPRGVKIKAPETGTNWEYSAVPSVRLDHGTHARNGRIGPNQITRFGPISFTGVDRDH